MAGSLFTRLQSLSAVLLTAAACTIIEDTDTESQAELAALSLNSFEVIQETSKGKGILSAKLNYDSVQNFTDQNTGAKIVRKVEYSMPALGNLKLKYRSGSTAANKIYIYYTDKKVPYTLGVVEKDSIVELYRFRYNSSNLVNRIQTIINPIDNKKPTVITVDTLIYVSGSTRITSITRKVSGTTKNYQVNYQTTGNSGNVDYVSGINDQATSGEDYRIDQGSSGYCSDNSGRSCTRFSQVLNGYQGSPFIVISSGGVLNLTTRLQLWEQRAGTNNPSGSPGTPNIYNREADTFYFHPTMLLRGQLPAGEHLVIIYMIDWWMLGAATTNPPNTDDFVSLKYTYK